MQLGVQLISSQSSKNIFSNQRMPVRKISQVLVRGLGCIFFGLALVSCVAGPTKSEGDKNRSRVFFAEYEEVVRITRIVMSKYPVKVEKLDNGILETEVIRDDMRFHPAHESPKLTPGYSYRLLVRLVRGKTDGKSAIKVQVSKIGEIRRDFFTEAEPVASDGLEELILLYRIQRELAIDRALQKSVQKPSQSSG